MHVNSFILNSDNVDPHSNQYAKGTSSLQTFSDRLRIERQRKSIGAYQQSKLGANFGTRGEYVRKRIQVPKRGNEGSSAMPGVQERNNKPATRQSVNSQTTPIKKTFTEPPRRGYNPYS